MKAIERFKPSKAEQKALDREINRQISQNIEGLKVNLLALILWQLHEQLGFGKKRLLRFHDKFIPALNELQEYYDMYSGDDTDWLCKRKLKEIGVDVDELSEILKMEYEVK